MIITHDTNSSHLSTSLRLLVQAFQDHKTLRGLHMNGNTCLVETFHSLSLVAPSSGLKIWRSQTKSSLNIALGMTHFLETISSGTIILQNLPLGDYMMVIEDMQTLVAFLQSTNCMLPSLVVLTSLPRLDLRYAVLLSSPHQSTKPPSSPYGNVIKSLQVMFLLLHCSMS